MAAGRPCCEEQVNGTPRGSQNGDMSCVELAGAGQRASNQLSPRSRGDIPLDIDDPGMVTRPDQMGHQGLTLAHAAVGGLRQGDH